MCVRVFLCCCSDVCFSAVRFRSDCAGVRRTCVHHRHMLYDYYRRRVEQELHDNWILGSHDSRHAIANR